jgi:hypothetical protein
MGMQYLKFVLSQDVSFFYMNTNTGEIIISISMNIVVVQDEISDKVCILNLQIRISLYSFKILTMYFCFVLHIDIVIRKKSKCSNCFLGKV